MNAAKTTQAGPDWVVRRRAQDSVALWWDQVGAKGTAIGRMGGDQHLGAGLNMKLEVFK